MSIDAYSLCPCGSGKKIKFCCNDLLSELQKIDRMLEGEQYIACANHIEQMLATEKNRGRECLLALQCTALRGTGQRDKLGETVAAFIERHPDNQIALAESALQKVMADARAAFADLLKAMRVAAGKIALQTYQAMGIVAAFLHQQGFPIPARALAMLMCEITETDQRARQILDSFSQTDTVPLLLRDDPPIIPPPEDAPWHDRFAEGWSFYGNGNWLTAAERFEALAAEVPDSPAVQHALATMRGLLADNPGCVEALRRFAELRAKDEDGLEDAVEAEATAMLLGDDPLGDKMPLLNITWTVKDADRAGEAFLSSPQWRSIPFDPARFSAADTPPPKGIYLLHDRPEPKSADGLTLDTMPRLLGEAYFFGRQTDQEARLEVLGVADADRPAVAELVAAVAGDAVENEPKTETVDHFSGTRRLLRPNWNPPKDAKTEQLDALFAQHIRQAVLERWPDMDMGVLDGSSPRQAADDPNRRTRLLGAIFVLESWLETMPVEFDCNELRSQLGLPTLDPIDPEVLPVERISAVRIGRLMVDRLSDTDLLEAHAHAAEFDARPALRKFARAIIERPSFADSQDREAAFVTMAQTERNPDLAIEFVKQGRDAALKSGKSCAMWDLMELSFNFARGNAEEAGRLVEHIQRKHSQEPGVNEALTQMFIDVGLLRPDGTPAIDPTAMRQPAETPAEPESSGLWTPDSEQGGGGGKLWTPE